ncbi:MAG TPA: type II and III secretion system protein family protein [Sphingomicrobium sp.]|jgi:pilus assembly protein CpaC|nr:type II and III secretion system protein family protein [Sphingomicrobium sp.]
MITRNFMRHARLSTALAAIALGAVATVAPVTPVAAEATGSTYKPTRQVILSTGEGQMVNTTKAVANVWTSNPDVADVYVSTPRQINLFGKKMGDATVIATARDGSLVYGANVHVSQNIGSVNEVLAAAMPGTDITVTPIGQIAVINGTVSSPEEAEQAQAIVTALLNPGKKADDALDIMPINRLRTATPLQVNLKVRIAEVSRDLVKQIGVNLLSHDSTGGFLFGVGRGNPGTITPEGYDFNIAEGSTTLAAAGHLFGLDLLSTLDLAETDGLVSTLAEPNLTALSGETASFLAGGEFPIPVSQSLGSVSIEYKQYGVSLAFTPIVLADGRISMRVRPEVSELSEAGAVKLNDFTVPALTTRRAETTVELGSGQSFMIAGLLKNSTNNNIDKAPFLGDLPILGNLFRSSKFRRQETELVIIVTPYLVRPMSGRASLPTDGYRAPTDGSRIFLNQSYGGVSGPQPVPGPSAPAPAIGGTAAVAAPGFKL